MWLMFILSRQGLFFAKVSHHVCSLWFSLFELQSSMLDLLSGKDCFECQLYEFSSFNIHSLLFNLVLITSFQAQLIFGKQASIQWKCFKNMQLPNDVSVLSLFKVFPYYCSVELSFGAIVLLFYCSRITFTWWVLSTINLFAIDKNIANSGAEMQRTPPQHFFSLMLSYFYSIP